MINWAIISQKYLHILTSQNLIICCFFVSYIILKRTYSGQDKIRCLKMSLWALGNCYGHFKLFPDIFWGYDQLNTFVGCRRDNIDKEVLRSCGAGRPTTFPWVLLKPLLSLSGSGDVLSVVVFVSVSIWTQAHEGLHVRKNK